MLITNGTIVTPGIRRRTIQRQVSLGPISMRFVTVLVIAAAALIALAQSTQSATKSYREQELKQELTIEEKELEEKQFESTRLQALQAITASQATASPSPSASAELETPTQVNYLPSSANSNLSQLTSDSLVE